jgi:hypothetical protein
MPYFIRFTQADGTERFLNLDLFEEIKMKGDRTAVMFQGRDRTIYFRDDEARSVAELLDRIPRVPINGHRHN